MTKSLFRLLSGLALLLFCSEILPAQDPITSTAVSPTWQSLGGPPPPVTEFASDGTRWWAATDYGLFYSADTGHTWQLDPTLGRIPVVRVYANDHVALAITRRTEPYGPPVGFFSAALFKVYRSTDHGASWTHVLTLDGYPEEQWDWFRVSEMLAANDSTLVLNYYNPSQFSGATLPILVSTDYGLTWQPRGYNIWSIGLNGDTLCAIRGTGNTTEFMTCTLPACTDITTTALPVPAGSNTVLRWPYQYQGVRYVFGTDGVLYARPPGAPAWQSITLPVAGTVLAVSYDGPLAYVRTTSAVYRGLLNDPGNWQPIFTGQGPIPGATTTFTALADGYWLSADGDATLFSSDGGATYSTRVNGLYGPARGVSVRCDTVFAYSMNGLWRTPVDTTDWSFVQTDVPVPPYKNWVVGQAGGFVYRYTPAYLQRSADCGATWQTLPLVVGAVINKVIEHGNRVYALSELDIFLHYSDDYGDTWTSIPAPTNIVDLFFFGDTLVAFRGTNFRVKVPGSATWQLRDLPVDPTNAPRAFQQGDTLVVLGRLNNLPDEPIAIVTSTDVGQNWTTSFSTTLPYHFPLTLPNGATPAELQPAQSDGIVLHAYEQAYFTANLGNSWVRIDDLPFFNTRPYQAIGIDSLEAPGARGYLLAGGWMYAATGTQGIWRTPANSLEPLTSDAAPAPATVMHMAPNPATTSVRITLPDGSAGSLQLYSLTGQLVKRLTTAGPTVDLNIADVAPGAYFVEWQDARRRYVRQLIVH